MKLHTAHSAPYLGIILGASLLSIGIIASAQGTTETPRSVAEERMATQEERRAERTEVREERRAALTQAMQERIINLASNVEKRLIAGANRMENIIGRLDSRIEKLSGMGVDTTTAQAKLEDAKSALEAAQNTLSDLHSVRNAVGSDTPRETFASVRLQFTATHDLLKQTHEQLRETLALLKEAVRTAQLNRGVSSAVTDTPSETEAGETTESVE